MFLDELEPGTMFRLTPSALKAERERLLTSGNSALIFRAEKIIEGPYHLAMPQYSAGPDKYIVSPEVYGSGGWFKPTTMLRYEVEVISSSPIGLDTPLPSRSWITTSADPEVFLEQNGQIVPGFAVLPAKTTPAFASEGGGLFHEDGFQAEFSPQPWQCHETMIYSLGCVIHDMVTRANGPKPQNIQISDLDFVELSPELLATGTDAQVALGCDRSENVWGHPPVAIDNARKFPYRMAGGHIHFGTTASAKWFHSRAERIIKAMDVFCGVPSVALFAGIEDDRRRQYYGRAGEFRFQKHGLEYRTLSNAWLKHPALAHLTLNLARGAFRLGTSDWESSFKYDPGLVRHIINEYDVKAAKKFVEDNAKLLIWLMDMDGGYGWGPKGLTTIYEGAKSVFGSHLGIHKSWCKEAKLHEPIQFHRYCSEHNISSWNLPSEKKKTANPSAISSAIPPPPPPPPPSAASSYDWFISVSDATAGQVASGRSWTLADTPPIFTEGAMPTGYEIAPEQMSNPIQDSAGVRDSAGVQGMSGVDDRAGVPTTGVSHPSWITDHTLRSLRSLRNVNLTGERGNRG